MIGFYNYSVWLTYVSLLSGVCGICFATNNNPLVATICLIVSGVCDMFDGKIARMRERTEEEKKYGMYLDSLSDLVCFGVLPVMIALGMGLTHWACIPFYCLFVLAGLIRLAYFNVIESTRKKGTEKVFYGLPITTSAIIFPVLFIVARFVRDFKYFYFGTIVVLTILFVWKFKMKAPSIKFAIGFAIFAGILIIALILMGIL